MLELEDNLFKWAKSMVADLGPMELLREQASSRKYYRVTSKEKSFILAYSDPQKELNNEFIKYSGFLIKNNVLIKKTRINRKSIYQRVCKVLYLDLANTINILK